MFKLGNKNSFGIDIGTQTIKITELSNRNNQFYIDNYSIWDDDIENVIQEKDTDISLSAEKITKIIQVMASEAGMNIKQAYISLPSYLAFFAIIQIPILDLEELLSAVPLEARKHIPVPLNTVQLDWINLGKSITQDQYNILIIAMPNSVISKYVEISKSLGVVVKGFDLDCFSILRSMALPTTQTCILDFGARNSTVMVVGPDRKLQTIQSFDFGGNHITKLISQLRQISIVEAEKIKKQNGINGQDAEISDFIKKKINNFVKNDIMRLVKQSDVMTGKKIENIVLLGGASKMTGMKDYIESILHNEFPEYNIHIDIAYPINNLKIKNLSDKAKFEDIWRDLFLSTGVALRNYIE